MKKWKWTKGAIALAVVIGVYVVGGAVTVGAYSRNGRAGDRNETPQDATLQAEAPAEMDTTMSEEEYEAFMQLYGSAAVETETEERPEPAAEEKQDLSAYRQVLEEADQVLDEMESSGENSTEANSEAAAAGETQQEGADEETALDAKVEETDKTGEEDNVETDTNTYYTYKVTGIGSSLTLHRTKTEKNDSLADIPEGYSGYVLQEPASGEKRTLIIYKGIVGYGSNMYLSKSDIPASEYPDELKSITADDAGKTMLDGAAAGPLEGQH